MSGNFEAKWKQDTAVKVLAGASVAAGLWSWWAHVSNNEAIQIADELYQECHACLGQQEKFVSNDLEASLYGLRSCVIVKRQEDIVALHKSIERKNRFFWNRSARMTMAYRQSRTLKESVVAYRELVNKVEQQIVAQEVSKLWNKLLVCNWSHDPHNDIVCVDTLAILSSHKLLGYCDVINELYAKLYKAKSHCYEFGEAYKKIVALKRALDNHVDTISQIQLYEEIVQRYQNFIAALLQSCNAQDIVACARLNSSGEFPLRNFVRRLSEDIHQLRHIKLSFAYIRLQHKVIIERDNALQKVIQYLNAVQTDVTSSIGYQDEERYYQEKLRAEAERRRLAEEQERLRQKVQKMDRELDHIKAENWHLKHELRNKQDK